MSTSRVQQLPFKKRLSMQSNRRPSGMRCQSHRPYSAYELFLLDQAQEIVNSKIYRENRDSIDIQALIDVCWTLASPQTKYHYQQREAIERVRHAHDVATPTKERRPGNDPAWLSPCLDSPQAMARLTKQLDEASINFLIKALK